MKNKRNAAVLSAAIPGMSLTTEKGNRAWERPPQYTSVEEVIPFYLKSLSNKKFLGVMFDSMEAGAPVTVLVDTMITAAVAEGKHTLDVGVLISPIMVEAFMRIADRAGIDYTSGLEDPEDEGKMSRASLRKMLDKAFGSEQITEEQLEVREEVQDAVANMPTKGLMAKRGSE
jgi:hypothetical protein